MAIVTLKKMIYFQEINAKFLKIIIKIVLNCLNAVHGPKHRLHVSQLSCQSVVFYGPIKVIEPALDRIQPRSLE